MNKKYTLWTMLIILALALAACRPSAPASPTAIQMDANAVFTAAAQTADARLTEAAAQTPTAPPATETPTQAPPTPTLQPTPAVTNTPAVAAPTVLATGGDNSQYVNDITVPDGTDYEPGETFTKTWQIKNTGSTTWTTAYKLTWVDGNQMGASTSVPLPNEVAPNQTVNVSVNMTAPSTAGNHKSFWRMANANGALFGTSIYVEIDVVGEGAAITGTPAAGTVSAVSLSVDDDDASSCPHTFVFNATITLSKAASVTYELEGHSDDASFDFDLPSEVTTTMSAGKTNLVFRVDVTRPASGWLRLNVSEPDEVSSDEIEFTLTCPYPYP